MQFSVVIATHNRAELLDRAICSLAGQGESLAEIIVVDDASTDSTPEIARRWYPTVLYLRQDVNKGAGAARNRGLRAATSPFVIILDDDDELCPEALRAISAQMSTFRGVEFYPVVQFATSNGSIPEPFLLVRLDHYIDGTLRGDFVPVINRQVFLAEGFAYPEIRPVGEHLLWWSIATRYGIPTWADRVAIVHDDAPIRLTSPLNQVRWARDYAEMQELTLVEFGHLLETKHQAYLRTRRMAAATYWLLAGERARARAHLRALRNSGGGAVRLVMWMLSFLPSLLVRWAFLAYRRYSQAL